MKVADLPGKAAYPIELLMAADRVCNAAMWLVVHETYTRRVRLDGDPLQQEDFKANPQGYRQAVSSQGE